LAWEAVSQSRLKRIAKSPAHYLAALEEPEKEPTDAMLRGTLVHNLLDLGELTRVYVGEDFVATRGPFQTQGGAVAKNQRNTTAYKELREAEEAAHPNQTRVSQEDWDCLRAVQPKLWPLLTGRPEDQEVSIVWDDLTGVRCKGRIDLIDRRRGWLIDLKTTGDIDRFVKYTISDFCYHVQLEHYCAGYAALTGERLTPAITMIETVPPYTVHTARIAESTRAAGVELMRQWLDTLAECRRTGEYPGPELPDEWELPGASRKQDLARTIIHQGKPVTL
jgi:exodeoxyribonuclease VIII